MKELLLSMKPVWYELVESGIKIFEYRKNFPEEKIKAYIYVSSPRKEICAIMEFGERILLEDWEHEYADEPEIIERILDYKKRNRFAIQVIKVTKIQAIPLEKICENVNGFIAPQMYYCLDNNEMLREYIHQNTVEEKVIVQNCFDLVNPDDICRDYGVRRR